MREVNLETITVTARVGNDAKTCASALCTMDDANCFHMIRLELKTSVNDMNVSVKSIVTCCDVTCCATTLQGFNKHASSRREAVSDSRGVPRCTEKIFYKNSTLAHTCRPFDSSNPPYP